MEVCLNISKTENYVRIKHFLCHGMFKERYGMVTKLVAWCEEKKDLTKKPFRYKYLPFYRDTNMALNRRS